MNSDQFKPLSGVGETGKKDAQDKTIRSIDTLGYPSGIYNLANPKGGATMMDAVFGNSAQIYAAMIQTPKITNDVIAAFGNSAQMYGAMMQTPKIANGVMAAFGNSAQIYGKMMQTPKITNGVMAAFGSISELTASVMTQPKVANNVMAAFTSVSAITGSVMAESNTLSHMMAAFGSVNDIISSMPQRNPILDNAISAIGVQSRWSSYMNPITTHYKSFNISENSAFLKATEIAGLGQYSRSKSEGKKHTDVTLKQDDINEILTQSIDQFVDNIGNVVSKVSEIKQGELSEIKFNFGTAIKQDLMVGGAAPITLYVLEYIFKHYNEILEGINEDSVSYETLRHFLQTANPDNTDFSLFAFFFVIALGGWIGKFVTDIASESKEQKALGNSSMDGVTAEAKMVLAKPHGNGRVVCEIPRFTKVQLFTVKKGYVLVKFLHEGRLMSGWTKNKQITADPAGGAKDQN